MADIPELSQNQWQEYLDKLTLYASWKFNRLGWTIKQGFERAGPGGESPPDIAVDAIASVLEGKRQYNKKAYPEFYDFLRSIVDSKISHICESVTDGRVREEPIPQMIAENGDFRDIEFESPIAEPLQLCINQEIAIKAEKILTEEFSNDDHVKGIIECLRAGITKPEDMAEILGIQVAEIYNIKKKLLRAVNKKLGKLKMEHLHE